MRTSIIAGLLLAGCSAPTTATPATPPAEDENAAPSNEAHHWGYLGPGAPDNWAQLDPEFAKCAQGQFQSPIDLRPIAAADVDMLDVAYKPDALRIVNNGHTVQVNHQAGSTIRLRDHDFRLLQYHLHSPSEHTESGAAHALEIHLVHQDEEGNFAVVAVFVDEGPDTGDPALWRHLPADPDAQEHVYGDEPVDPSHLLPPSLEHYQYHGSLTTPPCTETVTWNVLTTPITMSPEHIAHFRELYAANARPVQPRPTWCLAPHVVGEAPEYPIDAP